MLIMLGSLLSLLGIVVVFAGALIWNLEVERELLIELDSMPSGPAGGFVAVVGAIVTAFGVVEVLSGIFALLGRAWARVLAIVVSVLGGLFAVVGILGSRADDAAGPAVEIVIVLVMIVLLIAYAFVVGAMARSGRYFAER